jgi:copper(I)-binding protein
MIKAKPDRHMRSLFVQYLLALLACALLSSTARAAGRLDVSQAWIRAAPPGAMMLAGYAILHNSGDAPVTIIGADSADFASVSLHQSVEENGVERMRPLGKLSIAPGAGVTFTPGAKHFMLMRPARELKSGDAVRIHIATEAGQGASAEFTVRDSAP